MHEAIRIVVVWLVAGGATLGFILLLQRQGVMTLSGKWWPVLAVIAWPVMWYSVITLRAKMHALFEFAAEGMVPPLLEWKPLPWTEPATDKKEERFRRFVARVNRSGKGRGAWAFQMSRLLQINFSREPDPAKLSWYISGAGNRVQIQSAAGLVADNMPRWVAEYLLQYATRQYKHYQQV